MQLSDAKNALLLVLVYLLWPVLKLDSQPYKSPSAWVVCRGLVEINILKLETQLN